MIKSNNILYIKGLTGLRAIAACMVMIGHINQLLHLFKRPAVFINQNPSHGVTLFFVLSGFLITILLIKEQHVTNNISVKNFYIRRILRIWPLYFLMVLISLLIYMIYPQILTGSVKSFWFYLFFMPNLALALGMTINIIEPLWSVGVEEQFYLFWPLLMKRFKNRLLPLFITIIILYLLIYSIAIILKKGEWFIFLTRIDCMAIGAIGAYLYTNSSLKWLDHKIIQIAIISIFFFSLIIVNQKSYLYEQEIYSILYLFTILIIIRDNFIFIKFFENKTVKLIGEISYGIYIYHILIIYLCAELLWFHNLPTPLLFFIIISATFIVAYLSYNFFEKPILAQKSKFASIQTKSS